MYVTLMYLTRVRWESVWNIKSLNMFMSISPKIFHKNKYGFERHNDHFNNQCYLYTIAWL